MLISLPRPGQEGDQEGKSPLASGLVGPPWWDRTMTPVPDIRTEQTEGLNGENPIAGHLCLGQGNQCMLSASTDLGFVFSGPHPKKRPSSLFLLHPAMGQPLSQQCDDKERMEAGLSVKTPCPRARDQHCTLQVQCKPQVSLCPLPVVTFKK